MQGIDWNVELRKIEREMSGLPPEPSTGSAKARQAADQRAQERKKAKAALVGSWSRIAIVGLLAGGLYFWPYARTCGTGLFAYMGAELLIVAGGLWVTVHTWRGRLPKTHGIALLMVAGGLVLIGAQVLPRIGYARTDPVDPPTWMCKGGA